MTFLKIYLGKCWQKYFFSYFSQLWLASPFFNKTNFCQTKKFIYTYFDAMAEMAFWNIFLYCKIIIAFLEPFSAASFQCILQTHWTRRNTSIPKILENVNTWLSWWRHHRMAKWHLSIFLSRLIPYCQYSICTKLHVKWTNIFWDEACFFTAGLLTPTPRPTNLPIHQTWDFQKKTSPGWVNFQTTGLF